jgi:hypothetical protein
MKIDRPSPEWKEKFLTQVGKHILRGDYKSALPLVAAARKKYPKDVFCRYQYAKILGDWADELPPARKKKLKREAIAILRPLLRALGGETPKVRFGICLNYYYQSEDFPGMVRFGRKLAARRDRQGYYAMGIGASLEAMRRFREKDGRAKGWARKSRAAWRRYGLAREKYYFPHYIEAMAHAVLGDSAAGMRSLRRAARASKRPVTDWEFADVLALFAPEKTKS